MPRKGLTLFEVIIAAVIVVILVVAGAGTLLSSQTLSAFARHKLQAAYAAGQILEQERRRDFSSIVNRTMAVTLDTKGTYNTAADDLTGSANITVVNIDSERKKVQVGVSWAERVLTGRNVTVREFYATTIADEDEIN